ncbi:MAG: HDOD domain-containing protein [Candidatus Zixiibacteriota bacterium]
MENTAPLDKVAVIDRILRDDNIMSLPQALTEILREVDKPSSSADSLSKIILRDPALTSRILKLSNSAYYARFSRSSTVHQAVQVLGLSTVKCLALSSSVFDASKIKAATNIDVKHFFAGVLTIAVAAQKIAEAAEMKSTEEAFIAGLLHDIGIMFFLTHYPEEYRRVILRNKGGMPLVDAERKEVGLDHAEAGYHLAMKWRLPQNICEAIRDHHHYNDMKPVVNVTNVLRLATLVSSEAFEVSAKDPLQKLHHSNQIAAILGISRERLDKISMSLLSDAVQVAQYLEADIGSIEDILTRANAEIWRTYLIVQNLFKEREELTQKLLAEERAKGAAEAKNIAIATLSHYVNNAAMAMFGRTQILRQRLDKGETEKLLAVMGQSLDVIENGIRKTIAVLDEIKAISPIDEVSFYNMSQAMNIDDRIQKRLTEMTGLPERVVTPEGSTLLK